MKNKKIIFILIKVSIVFGLFGLLYKQLSKVTITDWENINIIKYDFIIYSFLLVFLNWGIEWIKWLQTINLIQLKNKKSLLNVFRSFMAGILTGLLTPSMLGNFIGRLYYFERKDRPNIILGTLITNYSQFFASIFFGALSVFILKETPWGINLNKPFLLFIISILILLLSFYFLFEKIKFKLLTRKLSFNSFISLLEKRPIFRLKILFLSILRHFIFTLQFWLLFNAFEHAYNFDTFLWIWQIFLWTTLLPSLWFGKLIIRESMALIVLGAVGFGQVEILLASILLWIINLAVPSVFSLFICKQKLVK